MTLNQAQQKKIMFSNQQNDRKISMILFEIPNIYKKHFFGRKNSKSREGVQFIYASNSFICEFAI